MSIVPESVPTGAIRYNTDSNKMECFNGTKWYQISVNSPDLNGGVRGVFPGGGSTIVNTIDYITISTQGNATDYGDLANPRNSGACFNSRTRGIVAGGENPSQTATMEYFAMASGGTSASFGNLTLSRRAFSGSGVASPTRGCSAGGYAAPAWTNIIDYVTIASTGNAIDFGDTTWVGSTTTGAVTNGIRALFGGGQSPSAGDTNIIQKITITTTGNAVDWGDLTLARSGTAPASNGIRGLWGGGGAHPARYNTIDYIEIATQGNAMDFGDMTTSNARFAAESSVRAVFAGGYDHPGGNAMNNMEYNSFATKSNSVDFGDLTAARAGTQGLSTGRGGL